MTAQFPSARSPVLFASFRQVGRTVRFVPVLLIVLGACLPLRVTAQHHSVDYTGHDFVVLGLSSGPGTRVELIRTTDGEDTVVDTVTAGETKYAVHSDRTPGTTETYAWRSYSLEDGSYILPDALASTTVGSVSGRIRAGVAYPDSPTGVLVWSDDSTSIGQVHILEGMTLEIGAGVQIRCNATIFATEESLIKVKPGALLEDVSIRFDGGSIDIDGATLLFSVVETWVHDPGRSFSVRNTTLRNSTLRVSRTCNPVFESIDDAEENWSNLVVSGIHDHYVFSGWTMLPTTGLRFELTPSGSVTVEDNICQSIYVQADQVEHPIEEQIVIRNNTIHPWASGLYNVIGIRNLSASAGLIVENNTMVDDSDRYWLKLGDIQPTGRGRDGVVRRVANNTHINYMILGDIYDAADGCYGVLVEDNELKASDSAKGGVIVRGNDNVIRNNLITRSRYNHVASGVLLTDWEGAPSTGNTIVANEITSYAIGVELQNAATNTIHSNLVKYNEVSVGLRFSNTARAQVGPADNTIYNNWFGSASTQHFKAFDYDSGAGDPPANAWNVAQQASTNILGTSPIAGNYWDDYTGADADTNGLGDEPRILMTNNQDNLPLVPPSADLAVALVSAPTTVAVGQEFEATFALTNHGPNTVDATTTFDFYAYGPSEVMQAMEMLSMEFSAGEPVLYPPDYGYTSLTSVEVGATVNVVGRYRVGVVGSLIVGAGVSTQWQWEDLDDSNNYLSQAVTVAEAAPLTTSVQPPEAATAGCYIDPSEVTDQLAGTTATLTARSAAGWGFTGWEGGATGTASPIQITIQENHPEIIGRFFRIAPVLSLSGGSVRQDFPKGDEDLQAVTVLPVTLTADDTDSWQVSSITFQASGSGDETEQVTAVDLYLGQTKLSSGTYGANNGTVTLNVGQIIPAGGSVTLHLRYTISIDEYGGFLYDFAATTRTDLVVAEPDNFEVGTKTPAPPAAVNSGPIRVGTVWNPDSEEVYGLIQDGVDADNTTHGHTLHVYAGDYPENVDVTKSLTIESVEGRGAAHVQAPEEATDHVFDVSVSSTSIEGFRISGATDAGKAGVCVHGTISTCGVRGCIIESNHYGVYVHDGATSTMIGGASGADGNWIVGTHSHGVYITGATTTESLVRGNRIGTQDGEAAQWNGGDGVRVEDAPQTVVQGNLISGNQGHGVHLSGTGAGTGSIMGNVIGLDRTGLRPLAMGDGGEPNGNQGDGIRIDGSPDTTVDIDPFGARNIVSGNGGDGVHVIGTGASGTKISGNYIGTDKDGGHQNWGVESASPTGNGGCGVCLEDTANCLVGVSGTGSRNVISGNNVGVRISGGTATGNRLDGNSIGVDETGQWALPNGIGVRLIDTGGNTIGGEASSAMNIISGNYGVGVYVAREATGGPDPQPNIIINNYIGPTPTPPEGAQDAVPFYRSYGADPEPRWNGGGVWINGASTAIGGEQEGTGNWIAFNGNTNDGASGIRIEGNATNCTIRNNHIEANLPYGIDLGDGKGCLIRDNVVVDNGHALALRGGDGASPTNNTIYNNRFGSPSDSHPPLQLIGTFADSPTSNTWTAETQQSGTNIVGRNIIGGNYWSNYQGSDANNDGIGDTPYEIGTGGQNVDNWPLVPPRADVGVSVVSAPNGVAVGQEFEATFALTNQGPYTVGRSTTFSFSASGTAEVMTATTLVSLTFSAGESTLEPPGSGTTELDSLETGTTVTALARYRVNVAGALVLRASFESEWPWGDWAEENTYVEQNVTVAPLGSLSTSVQPPEAATAGCTIDPDEVTDQLVGSQVALTAHSATSWKFVGWEGGAAGTESPIQVVIQQDHPEVVGRFARKIPVLSLSGGSIRRDFPKDDEELQAVTVLPVTLTADDTDSWQANSITFQASGSGDETEHVTAVELYHGQNKLSTGTYSADNGTVTLNVGLVIPAGGTITLHLRYAIDINEHGGFLYDFNATTRTDLLAAEPENYETGTKTPQPPASVSGGPTRVGTVWNPDSEEAYGVIQDGIDAENTVDGHTLHVYAGTYPENVDVTKSLTIDSVDGRGAAHVQAPVATDHAFDVTRDATTIRGFQITGASGGGQAGVCVHGAITSCVVNECIIEFNHHGVYVHGGAGGTTIGDPGSADGNWIDGNSGHGVYIAGTTTSHSLVRANRIGTKDGETASWNDGDGVRIEDAPETDIRDNLISGNKGHGVHVTGTNAADGSIQGNVIGLDRTGMRPLDIGGRGTPNGNQGHGIHIDGSPGTDIGGDTPAARNTISGNAGDGVHVLGEGAAGTRISGNYIGTDQDGDSRNGTVEDAPPAGNGARGINLEDAVGCQVGVSGLGAGNVISANGAGIRIGGTASTGNVVDGNYIGTDKTGEWALPNGIGIGLVDTGGNTIGGTSDTARNIISGNSGAGIYVLRQTTERPELEPNTIVGNWIGPAVSGEAPPLYRNYGFDPEPRRNAGGIWIKNAANTLIGGEEEGTGNLIAFNGDEDHRVSGVKIEGDATGCAILGNSIHSNVPYGIDLGGDGATMNDPQDSDTGPNERQNYPIISGRDASGTVSGTLKSQPGTTYRLEFFDNVESIGQGETFLVAIDAATNAEGLAAFAVGLAEAQGQISATATDPDGNSSEFSLPTLIVNRTGDESDVTGDAICDVSLDQDGPQISLRAAIEFANQLAGPPIHIVFDIPEGRAVPVISPASELPTIERPVTLDGRTQSSGRVILDGSSAGDTARGVHVTSGDCVVTGLTVRHFGSHGIEAEHPAPVIELQDVSCTDNGGWGILADGVIDINLPDVDNAVEIVCEFSRNATGEGEAGGGMFSYFDEVQGQNVKTEDNGGPGILAETDITLEGVQSARNKGPGVQSLSSSILFRPVEGGLANQVNENLGYGIRAWWEGDDDRGRSELAGVGSWANIEVKDNAGAGIVAEGDVVINMVNGSTRLPYPSTISGNGFGDTAWVVDRAGKVTEVSTDGHVFTGGVRSLMGEVRMSIARVNENGGPGVVADGTVQLFSPMCNGNWGPGIRGFAGVIIVESDGLGFESEVRDNLGYGIRAEEELTAWEAVGNGLTAVGPIQITGNAAAGVRTEGYVAINQLNGMTSSKRVSNISNNGKGEDGWVVVEAENLPLDVDCQTQCALGGVHSVNSSVGVSVAKVENNGGPGIVSAEDAELRAVQCNGNKGAGIRSFGSVVVELFEGAIENQANSNLGYGIMAEGTGLADSEKHSVVVTGSVEAQNNAAAGIFALGAVHINHFPGGASVQRTSVISNNGKGATAWVTREKDGLTKQVNCETDCDLSGVYSEDGSVWARYVTASNNGDHGVFAEWDAELLVGTLAQNGSYGVSVGRNLAADLVTMTGNALGGAQIGHDEEARSRGTTGSTSLLSGCTIGSNQGDGVRLLGNVDLGITGCNIVDNTGYGVSNLNHWAQVDATGNWWGSADGPDSGDTHGAVNATGHLGTPVRLVVTPGPEPHGLRGDDLVATFTLGNLTETIATYTIQADQSLTWQLQLDSADLTVEPGSRGDVTVTLTVPSDAPPGEANALTLTVTDQADGNVTATTRMDARVDAPRINEIHPGEQWIEIANPLPTPVDLTNWRLGDYSGNLDLVIPTSAPDWDGVLDPGAFLVIHLQTGDTTDTPGEDLHIDREGVLVGTGHAIALLNPNDSGMDFMRYGDSTDTPPVQLTWTGDNPPAPLADQSLGRDVHSSDSDDGNDWEATAGIDAEAPTPGAPNIGDVLITLSPGWNLVSIPFVTQQTASELFAQSISRADGTVDALWSWAETQYRAANPDEPLTPTVGYWGWFSGAAPAQFRLSGTPPVDPTATVKTGWNLFGPIDDIPKPQDAFIWQPIYGWDGTVYFSVDDDPQRPGWVHRTDAYWLFSSSPVPQSINVRHDPHGQRRTPVD
ncbi:MAG: hypothetical protein HN742_34760 [Lentisphaerae bacterium]|jgi:parallel beta-helix repeat protein|nr:hypothetical protein [Lentisphaerota bacterium]MBT7057341.1 hypothetical protein [Lentisphaerota bacterium]MBT7847084.1 hypothetical protein [Lentisphaerota bacterium]